MPTTDIRHESIFKFLTRCLAMTPDPRTIAAVRAAGPRNDGACVYPACVCLAPILIRHALAGADAWDAAQRAYPDIPQPEASDFL